MASEEPKQPTEASDVAAVAAILAIRASADATAPKVSTLLGGFVTPAVALAVLSMALGSSRPAAWKPGTIPQNATEVALRAEPLYRAAYVVAASRRVAQKVREGRTLDEAMKAEATFFGQHVAQKDNRARVAKLIDKTAARYGDVLGWYATLDSRTSPECRSANKKNFTVVPAPAIGYPGTVHRTCRCKPGKPHRGAPTIATLRKVS